MARTLTRILIGAAFLTSFSFLKVASKKFEEQKPIQGFGYLMVAPFVGMGVLYGAKKYDDNLNKKYLGENKK